jgi:HEPN domain-containing protein
MTPQLEEARRLLRLALRDQETFALLLPLPQANLAAIGFHAQQSAEKALKAIAVLRGIEFQRTHDLAALAQAILESGGELCMPVDDLRRLNPFAVEFRYDDELIPSISREELENLSSALIKQAGLLIGDAGHKP